MEKLSLDDIDSVQELNMDDIVQPEKKSALENILSKFANLSSGVGDSVLSGAKDVAQTVGDTTLGATQGISFGFADEALAAAQAAASEKPFFDAYKEELPKSREIFNQAEERSPIAYNVGDYGTGILTGIASGGAGLGVKGALKGTQAALQAAKSGAKLGALSGLGTSEGSFLTGEGSDAEKALIDTGIGAGVGGALGGAIQSGINKYEKPMEEFAVKAKQKISDLVDNNDYLRKFKVAHQLGKEGYKLNPINKADELAEGVKSPDEMIKNRMGGLTQTILDADKQLGKAVENSFVEAEKLGKKIKFQDDVVGQYDEVQKLADKLGFEIGENPKILANIKKEAGSSSPKLDESYFGPQTGASTVQPKAALVKQDLRPTDAQLFLKDIDGTINQVENATRTDASLRPFLSKLYNLRNSMSQQLKDENLGVPGYRKAASNLENFRKNIQENIIFKNLPENMRNKTYSSLPDKEKKLYQAMESNVIEPFYGNKKNPDPVNIVKSMKKYINENPDQPLKSNFIDDMLNTSDVYDTMVKAGTKPSLDTTTGTAKGALKEGINLKIGQQMLTTQANRIGLGTSPVNKAVDLSKKLYNMPSEKLHKVADLIEKSNVPGSQKYSEALRKGLESNNKPAINAALFIMLQNPETRNFLTEGEEEAQ